jgi:hypothetical protein
MCVSYVCGVRETCKSHSVAFSNMVSARCTSRALKYGFRA